MKTLTQLNLDAARAKLAVLKGDVFIQKAFIRVLLDDQRREREYLKTLRAENRLARETAKAAKAAKAAADRDARIARMESKLKELKAKQYDPKVIRRKNRKAGPVVQISL